MSAQWPPPDADTAPRAPEPGYGQNPPPMPPQNPYPQNPYPQGQPWAYPPPQQWGPPQGQPYPPGPPTYWTTAPPQPLADQPPNRPPRSGGWVAALVAVVGVVVLGVVATLALPYLQALQLPDGPNSTWPMPNQSSPATSPTRSPKPTSSPTPTMPTDPEMVLKKNPIYAIKAPAKCPAQSIPSGRASFRKQVQALVDCENKAWRKALAATPVTFAKPKVVFYNSSTTSPCGSLGTRYPAAYCTGDRTLYFSTAAYAQGRYYRLAVAQFVMHEYAHHVQELADIFDSDWALDEKSAVTTRRIELQAHCMAHYQLTHSDIGFSASDRADAEYQFSYTTDAKGHGSVTAERYWGRRGLTGSKIGACNTWTVRASQVK
ncbi:MAG: neutral zinc metallopeptidase [Propionibacteriaceae bacterium]|nr:neutral zinc metallopeptidase [Propionibacteriaceae bacterium]